jgi:hypothetical protein
MSPPEKPIPPHAPSELPELPDARLGMRETAENVEAMVESVRHLLAAEESRDQSFIGRGVGLAGFLGIIISLSTSLGRDLLQGDLPQGWTVTSMVLFGGGLVLLLLAVAFVVGGVLLPRDAAHLAYSEVARYPMPDQVYQHRVMTQGKILRGLVDVLRIERERGDRKAKGLRWGYRLMIGGLLCIAALGTILGLHEGGVIPSDRSISVEYRLCLAADTSATAAPTAAEFAVREACSSTGTKGAEVRRRDPQCLSRIGPRRRPTPLPQARHPQLHLPRPLGHRQKHLRSSAQTLMSCR